MKKTNESRRSEGQNSLSPRRISLPRFITDEEIGLGDVIKRATSYFGIKPCRGCERRAAALNRRVVFTNRHPA